MSPLKCRFGKSGNFRCQISPKSESGLSLVICKKMNKNTQKWGKFGVSTPKIGDFEQISRILAKFHDFRGKFWHLQHYYLCIFLSEVYGSMCKIMFCTNTDTQIRTCSNPLYTVVVCIFICAILSPMFMVACAKTLITRFTPEIMEFGVNLVILQDFTDLMLLFVHFLVRGLW